MRLLVAFSSVLVSLALVAPSAKAQAVVGKGGPPFALTDSEGKPRTLAEFSGKTIVIEWWNPDCPFVAKHYSSGNMPRLQKEWIGKGVVWLTINSSAPGKQGHMDGAAASARMKKEGGAPTAVLLDPNGIVGKAYGAKTTPHMFVIDKMGIVVYAGGIDDKPSTDEADLATATNHVSAALAEVLGGKAVKVKTSTPYGCSVKYAD